MNANYGNSYYVNMCMNFAQLDNLKQGDEKKFPYPITIAQKKDPKAAKDAPYTSFKARGVEKGIITFDTYHYKAKKTEVIWNATEMSLVLEKSSFATYFRPEMQLIILAVNKPTAKNIISQLLRYYKQSGFQFKTFRVDFDRLLDDQSSRDITLTWFDTRNIHTNVTAEGLLGSKINNDEEFKNIKDKGAFIKSGKILFNYNNIEIVAQVSHGASVYFPTPSSIEIELEFLLWLSQFFNPISKKE